MIGSQSHRFACSAMLILLASVYEKNKKVCRHVRATFSFPLCFFLHLTTILPCPLVSPCAVAAG